MDEKKVKAPRKINIKNKKDAQKTLAKSTIKGKTNSSKAKKLKVVNKINNIKDLNANETKSVNNNLKSKEIKTPNNIKRKVEIPKDKVKDKSKKKSKIELPKEWKLINKKNEQTNKRKTQKSLSDTQGFKGKLKSSIFVEIDEQELKEQKKIGRKKLKKNLIILFVIVLIIVGVFIALIKYNDFVKKQLAIYDVYKIGDKVELNDNSIWYVVKDSDSKESTVTLLSDNILDVNSDGAINNDDKLQFNTNNKAEFDIENEGSVAYYLSKDYKQKLDNIGKITDIRLLTSKEYVKIRERMGYGYEWNDGNWLANTKNDRWWVNSSQNDKIYVVKSNGIYTLVSPNTFNYVRIVIDIDKDSARLVEEQRKMRVDLINGLKN